MEKKSRMTNELFTLIKQVSLSPTTKSLPYRVKIAEACCPYAQSIVGTREASLLSTQTDTRSRRKRKMFSIRKAKDWQAVVQSTIYCMCLALILEFILADSGESFRPSTASRCEFIAGVGFLRGLPCLGLSSYSRLSRDSLSGGVSGA